MFPLNWGIWNRKISICFHFSISLLLPFRYDDFLRWPISLDGICNLEKCAFLKLYHSFFGCSEPAVQNRRLGDVKFMASQTTILEGMYALSLTRDGMHAL